MMRKTSRSSGKVLARMFRALRRKTMESPSKTAEAKLTPITHHRLPSAQSLGGERKKAG